MLNAARSSIFKARQISKHWIRSKQRGVFWTCRKQSPRCFRRLFNVKFNNTLVESLNWCFETNLESVLLDYKIMLDICLKLVRWCIRINMFWAQSKNTPQTFKSESSGGARVRGARGIAGFIAPSGLSPPLLFLLPPSSSLPLQSSKSTRRSVEYSSS